MNWEFDLHQMYKKNEDLNNSSLKNRIWFFASLCAIFFVFMTVFSFKVSGAKAPQPVTKASLIEYLNQEKAHLLSSINESKQKIVPKNTEEYQVTMESLRAYLAMTQAKITNFQGFLDNQTKQENNLNLKLKHLQQLPLDNKELSIEERVAKIETLLTINKSTTDLISENIELAQQYQITLQEEIKKLKLWKANHDLEQKLVEIHANKVRLNEELAQLYFNKTEKQGSKIPSQNEVNSVYKEANIMINNQKITMIYQNLNALAVQKGVVKANIALLNNSDTKTLQYVNDTYKDAIYQYNSIEKSLLNIVSLLNNELTLSLNSDTKAKINSLLVSIKKQIEDNKIQNDLFIKNQNEYQAQLKKLTSSRQSLAEYSMKSWPTIMNKMADIPRLFYKYIKILSLKIYDSYTWLDTFTEVLLWTLAGLTAIVFFSLDRFLRTRLRDQERSRLTGYLYDGALTLVQRNTFYLGLFSILWIVLYFTNISYSNYQLLFNLIEVWFTFRTLILVARMVLLERITDSSGKDVKLYYRLKWLLLFGGWATALMVFSHVLPLTLLLQDIFNRLFMLFILSVSLVTWKSKDIIPYLLRPLLKGKKRYIRTAISLLVTLIPITLFTTATFGLLGFVNLAWTMSRYQAYMLIVLVGYILSRGLMFDALELLSEWMISSLKNGWLWIEVFLKPLDGILRIILLLLSVTALFQLFGWHSDSMVFISLEKFAQYTLVNMTGIHITVASVIECIMLLTVFLWVSKWTREFCYRWLFRNAKDIGIRNSLSVFTQYAVIILGCFIAFHVLGLDFSGMSMILGGFAVGMGFGLRDFASNIVGGIMLLIERPVREGDLISIGEYEGQVEHIGIRSMRVCSWDNTQVLIPNAETFNKPFTNWTHQDGIVRTVIPIKVSRSDDPVMIQQLILDVLAIIPEIVADPPVQVFLKKIDTALIEFEARYFINVQLHSRVEVRSKVLFAITAQFKAAGVKPPIEPITVEFKEGHGNFSLKNSSPED